MENEQYLDIFIEEGKEHLQIVSTQLLELEKNPSNLTIVGEIFRSAHTIKGMAATMGFEDLANLTHKMENVLDAIRGGDLVVDGTILDVVFDAVDDLEAMLSDIANGGSGKRDVSAVTLKLKAIEAGDDVVTPGPALQATDYDQFERTVLMQSQEQGFFVYEVTVQLRADCLLKGVRVFMVFEVLEQVGEIIKTNPETEELEAENFEHSFTVTLVTKETADDVQARILTVSEIEQVFIQPVHIEAKLNEQSEKAQSLEVEEEVSTTLEAPIQTKPEMKKGNMANKTIRVNIDRLDVLMNLFEELVIDRGRLEQISSELGHPELNETVEHMSRISSDLQSIILNMRMVPVEQVFNRFPKMVRQLARDLNKQIHLEVVGAETELDRTVIDEIGDPLVHLLRNAIDHGIERPDERINRGKAEQGTIVLKAYHSGNHVFIEIEDDGAGINREKVLQKAIERKIVTAEAGSSMTDQQVYELIMASGFSTAEKISDISGRGVGLDVVKNTIESLSGSITIDSKFGEGSVFSIQLPLTLSIISVLLTEVQAETYAIPLSSIIETAIIRKDAILNAHNQKVIDFRGKVVPLVNLKDIFAVPSEQNQADFISVVIVRKGDKMAGLVVDSFIGQQEIVLKSLGSYLTSVFAISGATILGNGQVALIIDCNALIK